MGADTGPGQGAVLPPDPMRPVPCRILWRRSELADTFTLALEPPGGSLVFAPGQFNMLYCFGIGEVPVSICGDPHCPGELLHTIRAVGAVTRALGRLVPGDFVGLRGPFGRSWPVEEAAGNDLLLVAGGLGLAPLRPVVLHLLNQRERFRRVCLAYGARSPEDMLYRQELDEWRRRGELTVELTVDRSGRDWSGRVGLVTQLLDPACFDPGCARALVCGPEVMMRHVVRALNGLGLENGRIWVSLERNMQCGVGLCGHCQWGADFVCRDGPVFCCDTIAERWHVREL
ncbi:MAG: Ni/Fe hydrogenase subunit gamma [Desulfobulbaceae bacterium A2]|nr:MAG: Ni/Fe hydrogenase subunit gamma [Desulfobulbaceae bacterium A2]